MSNVNIFEQASRLQLRFPSAQGNLSAEHLWQMPLETLDGMARETRKQLREQEEESLLPQTKRKNKVQDNLLLKYEILAHIISVRLDEDEKRKARSERRAQLAQLKELAATKANEQLASQSLDEILKKIAEMEAEDE